MVWPLSAGWPRLSIFQKSGFSRVAVPLPVRAATWLTPSGEYDSGSFTPATSQNVGSRSTAEIKDVLSTFPAAIFPGQRAMKGTQIPPSKSEAL